MAFFHAFNNLNKVEIPKVSCGSTELWVCDFKSPLNHRWS